MLPSKITLRNYRSFLGEHDFEIRPLTLVYGANNVGKSALLRIWPLLADSVRHEMSGALDLDSQALFGGGFSDLRWKGRDLPPDENSDFAFTLHWGQGQIHRATYEIDWIDRNLAVRSLTIHTKDHPPIEYQRAPNPDQESSNTTFVTASDRSNRFSLEFHGLLPHQFPDSHGILSELADAMRQLRGRVHWLRAPRSLTGRRFRCPPGPRGKLSPDGSDAPQAIWADTKLRESVSSWFQTTVGRSIAIVDEEPDSFRCALSNRLELQSWMVDLIDSGNGPIQVLPVITASALVERSKDPSILCIEEPDANLDVLSQIRLAEHLVSTAASSGQSCTIVETHSQALMLGVQLALARGGQLSSEDVIVYWIEQDERGASVVNPVTFDEIGQINSGIWPSPDPYSEIRGLTRDLVKLWQSKRQVP